MSTGDLTWHPATVDRATRWERHGLVGATVWFTGLSGSGKSTLADAVATRLFERGRPAYVLDGDNVRHGLNCRPRLLAGRSDRERQADRRGCGVDGRRWTDRARPRDQPVPRRSRPGPVGARGGSGLRFVEVFVDTPLAICEQRDPKGLYAKARAGELTGTDRDRRSLRAAGGAGPHRPPRRSWRPGRRHPGDALTERVDP